MPKEKILVVEDAPDISSLLKIYFTSQGYEVMTAMRGQAALDMCRKTAPNLALLDVNLPDMEGYDIGKALRRSVRTRHIPIIFLTARGERLDRLRALGEIQATAYIVKPFDIEEVHAIIKEALDRARQKNLAHPVTNLPTAALIQEQFRQLVASSGQWALAQIHINGFDTYTQAYGPVVGEDVLKYTALMLNEIVNELGSPDDFIGQMVVGPDFVVTSSPAHMKAICTRLCERFDAEIGLQYNYRDRRNGYIVITDEQGGARHIPLMSLAIGIVTSEYGPFYDIRELSEVVTGAQWYAVSEARELGRKSHWCSDGYSDPPAEYSSISLIQQTSLSTAYSSLYTRYEDLLKERSRYEEDIRAHRDQPSQPTQAEIDRLTMRLNHDLGSAFDRLQRAIAEVSKRTKTGGSAASTGVAWLNNQYQLCDALRRSIIECGTGFTAEKKTVEIRQWFSDCFTVMREQLILDLKLELPGIASPIYADIDPTLLNIACIYTLLAAQAAGASFVRVGCQLDPELGHVMVTIDDDGARQPRLKYLRIAANSQAYHRLSEASALNLLARVLFLQHSVLTVSAPYRSGLRMHWKLARPEHAQTAASLPLDVLHQDITRLEARNNELRRQALLKPPAPSPMARMQASQVVQPHVERLEQALNLLTQRAEYLATLQKIDTIHGEQLVAVARYSYLLLRNLTLTLFPSHLPAEPVDINTEIRQVQAMLAPKFEHQKVQFKLMPRLPAVHIARLDAQQIILNLIKNALEAQSEPGDIEIITSHLRGLVSIRVIDTGKGIAPANREDIFQLDHITKSNATSYGLGLPVVQTLVQANKGAIRIASGSLDDQRHFVLWRHNLPDDFVWKSTGTFFQIDLASVPGDTDGKTTHPRR